VKKAEIVDHRIGNSKGPEEVFFAIGIDSVFDTDTTIILGKHGGGKTNEPNASVRSSSSKTNNVEVGTAANANDVGMAINTSLFNSVPGVLKRVLVSFAFFSSHLDDYALG
jgi:hypothetical protein